MNTPKKYNREELASKLVTANTEVATWKVKYKELEINNEYSWQRLRTLVDRNDTSERRIWELLDQVRGLTKGIAAKDRELFKLKRKYWHLKILGWMTVIAGAAMLTLLLIR